ncbi:MAG: tetratricopeptide repeat protein, partial [Acidobacteriota bacterium]|nr:tetratricopeptide repeat protein [Acidobacteriota bacterium]
VARVQITWPSGAVQEFANLESGKTYQITEGSNEIAGQLFRVHKPLPATPVAGDNELHLHDTWFLEPVPLPEMQRGPGLFVVKESLEQYEIFRRYLFDWRTSMELPLTLLLNNSGDAVKVYARTPSAAQQQADLAQLRDYPANVQLPFEGFYVKPPKRDFFKFSAAFLWAGYPEQALPYLERVLQDTPDNARVLVLAGQIHLEGGRLEKAGKYFKGAAGFNPSSVNAYIGLGDIAAKNNQQQQAAAFYSRALTLDPESPEAANGLGLALAKQGQLDQAHDYLKQAIANRHDYSDAINNLGVLYAQQTKVNDAIAAFSYGIRVSPDDDVLYLNLGRLYARTGQIEKARLTMQQLLDRKPDNAIAKRALQELDGR